MGQRRPLDGGWMGGRGLVPGGGGILQDTGQRSWEPGPGRPPADSLGDLEGLQLTHTCQAHPAWGMKRGQEEAKPRLTRPLSGHQPLLGTQLWLLPPRFWGPGRAASQPAVESVLCEFSHPLTTLSVNLSSASRGEGAGSFVGAYTWRPELDGCL